MSNRITFRNATKPILCGLLVTATCTQQLSGRSVFSSPAGKTQFTAPQSGQTLDPAGLKALTDLETSYFQHSFADDAPEKRVKRLELFVNGRGQLGTIAERIARLKQQESIGSNKSSRQAALAPTKRNVGQSIATLEMAISKKTDPKSDVNTRLSALEKKVFGTTFTKISTEQRIARLQKTIGVGEEDIAEAPYRSFQTYSFGPQMMPPSGLNSSPFMSPFGSSPDLTTDPDINRHMSEMFDRLNTQLRQLHKMPPDAYLYPPSQMPRQFSIPSMPTMPNGTLDFSDGLPSLPSLPRDGAQGKQTLPPYLDPNSI